MRLSQRDGLDVVSERKVRFLLRFGGGKSGIERRLDVIVVDERVGLLGGFGLKIGVTTAFFADTKAERVVSSNASSRGSTAAGSNASPVGAAPIMGSSRPISSSKTWRGSPASSTAS